MRTRVINVLNLNMFFSSYCRLPAPASIPSAAFLFSSRIQHRPMYTKGDMSSHGPSELTNRTRAVLRLCNVSGYTTEVLEVGANNPAVNVVLIPGNPGIITFYTEFVEFLYDLLGGSASVTAVGHTSHTRKNWDSCKLFSLEEQIDHKIDFIKHELSNKDVPTILVGHSIGSYITVEMFRRQPEKVIYCIGLYPFLALNLKSQKQSMIGKMARSSSISTGLSAVGALLGSLPRWASGYITKQTVGRSWSDSATEALCTHFLQYHTLRNVLFMAKTEFEKFAEATTPDWTFLREKQGQIAFLFGVDDHWGSLSLYEEISKQVSGIDLSIEREGHTHGFSCSEAGSLWVAKYVAQLIKSKYRIQSNRHQRSGL